MSSTKTIWYVVAEDEHTYNVFSSDDFDSKGRYIVNPEYSIEDMDIYARFYSEDMAWALAEELNNFRHYGTVFDE